jgi:hypothetical protein
MRQTNTSVYKTCEDVEYLGNVINDVLDEQAELKAKIKDQ